MICQVSVLCIVSKPVLYNRLYFVLNAKFRYVQDVLLCLKERYDK